MLIFNTWDRIDANPFSMIAREVFTGAFPADPPQFLEVPFSMHDPDLMRSLVTDAGFHEVTVEHREVEVEAESAHSHATGMVRGTPASHGIAERGGNPPELIAAIAARAGARFGEAPSRFPTRTWVVTARA